MQARAPKMHARDAKKTMQKVQRSSGCDTAAGREQSRTLADRCGTGRGLAMLTSCVYLTGLLGLPLQLSAGDLATGAYRTSTYAVAGLRLALIARMQQTRK